VSLSLSLSLPLSLSPGDFHLINLKFKAMNGELDLILLEIGVNDFLGLKYAPYTEALVYSLHEVQPKAAIIMLSCLPRADELQKLPEAVNHLPLSLHLHTPFISIPHALLTTPPRNNTAASSLFTELKNVKTSILFLQLNQAGGLWPDGSHMSAAGHAWLAFSIAMFLVETIPRVRGMDLSHTPAVDVASLWEHVRLPEARVLKPPKSVVSVQSFIDTTPPKGLYLPKGWTHQNENERYGLIAFGVCNASSSTSLDPCSEPLSVEVGANTFVLTILRSYAGMGMVMVEAPSSMTFDVCETPLKENSQQCFLDGIFDEKDVLAMFSWYVHPKMHLIPRNNTAPSFPLNLTIHILSPALSHNNTPPNHTYWMHVNGARTRGIGFPERQNEKNQSSWLVFLSQLERATKKLVLFIYFYLFNSAWGDTESQSPDIEGSGIVGPQIFCVPCFFVFTCRISFDADLPSSLVCPHFGPR